MDVQALLLTLRLATVTTVVLIVVAIPLGYWLAYGTSRIKPLIQAVVALPLVLPPTVLGFYLLVLSGPRTSLGRGITTVLGHPLAFSFAGLVTGSVLYSLPFAVQPLVAGFSSIAPELRETALLLSAQRGRVFGRILLPLIRPFLWTAIVLTFTHTVGEFGVVLMIGGSIPGVTQTLSISIYDQVQDFAYAQANHTAMLLLSFSLIALVLIYWKRGKTTGWGDTRA